MTTARPSGRPEELFEASRFGNVVSSSGPVGAQKHAVAFRHHERQHDLSDGLRKAVVFCAPLGPDGHDDGYSVFAGTCSVVLSSFCFGLSRREGIANLHLTTSLSP